MCEELLRFVGNLARYSLAPTLPDHPVPADGVMLLLRPLIGAASISASGSPRRLACYRAMHRVLTEAPREALRPPTRVVAALQGLLQLLADPSEHPSREGIVTLGRLVQLIGQAMTKTDTHRALHHLPMLACSCTCPCQALYLMSPH